MMEIIMHIDTRQAIEGEKRALENMDNYIHCLEDNMDSCLILPKCL